MNANLAAFSEAARTCIDTVCGIEFATNDSCQRALTLQYSIEIDDPAGIYSDAFIEFLQGRIVLQTAYSRDLERKLGASAMGSTVCGKPVVPLGEYPSTASGLLPGG